MVVLAFRIPQPVQMHIFFRTPYRYSIFFGLLILMRFFPLEKQGSFRIFCNCKLVCLKDQWNVIKWTLISGNLLAERELLTERSIFLSIVFAKHTYPFGERFIYHGISHPTTFHTWEKPARKSRSKPLSAYTYDIN